MRIEKWNYPLYANQIVIEIKKDGKYENEHFIENYSTFWELKDTLYKNKEAYAVMALIDYIGRNANGFTFALSYADFNAKTGFKKTSYHSAVERLKELGILQPTERLKQDEKGIIAPIFIFLVKKLH